MRGKPRIHINEPSNAYALALDDDLQKSMRTRSVL